MELGRLSEDDIVEVFKAGLRAFVRSERGSFGARRVTLQEEKIFPSDQEFTIRFNSPDGFRLHLFGLQFKRWKGKGWVLRKSQEKCLKRFGHVIGYCLPLPGDFALGNALHGFYFANPSHVVAGASRLALIRPGEVLTLGTAPERVVEEVQHRIAIQLAIDDFSSRIRVVAPASTSRISELQQVVRSTPDVVRDSLKELGPNVAVQEAMEGGQSLIGAKIDGTTVMVPCLCWGDFLEAAKTGSVVVRVPGGPNAPPGPDEPAPERNCRIGPGLGLTFACSGKWGSDWVKRQIDTHVEHFIRTILEPPAAIIAYESFSRSMEFMEYRA